MTRRAVVGADGGLDVVEDAEAEVGAFCLKLVELGGEVLELGASESEAAMEEPRENANGQLEIVTPRGQGSASGRSGGCSTCRRRGRVRYNEFSSAASDECPGQQDGPGGADGGRRCLMSESSSRMISLFRKYIASPPAEPG